MLEKWANSCGFDVKISFTRQGADVLSEEPSDVELPEDFDGELDGMD